MNKVRFEGVIVGFESPPGFEEYKAIYIQGSIDGEPKGFYVLVSSEDYERIVLHGVGRLAEGLGEIVSEEPLVIRALELKVS